MLTAPQADGAARRRFVVLGEGLSAGLGFAALGVALYAQGPMWAAAAWYGAFGLVAGSARAWLRLRTLGPPQAPPPPLPEAEVTRLLRSALAQAQQARAARPGAPARERERQPQPEPMPTQRQATGAGAAAAAAQPAATRPAELSLP